MIKKSFTLLLMTGMFFAQSETKTTEKDTLRYVFEPDSLILKVGETGVVTIKLVDSKGNLSNNPFLIYGQPRRSLKTFPRISDSTGFAKVTVQPFKSGKLKLRTRSITVKRIDRQYGSISVDVPDPKIERERKRINLKDKTPSLIPSDSGNKFYSLCPLESSACQVCENVWHEVKDGHFVMCHQHRIS